MITQDQALDLHSIIIKDEPGSLIEAANYCAKLVGVDQKFLLNEDSDIFLHGLYILLLDQGKFTEAALLQWGREMFDPRPRSVQRIWAGLMNYSRVLIPGGGGQGKSYTPAAWAVLWWSHDPRYTSVKIISVTSTHAAANIFATIRDFHSSAAIKLPGRIMENSIDLGDGNKRSAIMQVALPVGQDVKGRLRGFHPIKRPHHRVFGNKSRIAVLIDEGEDAPDGLWEGLENILSTETSDNIHIKVVSGANPKKPESPYAQRCLYPGGPDSFDIETSEEWDGPIELGKWHVIRLDPAKSENVVEKKEIYAGMMTYEGYTNYLRKGQNSPDYYTFARGAWPTSAAEFRITPSDYFHNSRGTLILESDAVPMASFDPALAEGGDDPILTTGRFGTAIGFTDINGNFQRWIRPHKAIQIEQQFEIPKANTLIMAESVIQILRQLHVRPEWFIMDKSGVGWGMYDAISIQYGQILGQSWSDAASERKILTEDTGLPDQQYQGVNTEMMFAFAYWLQYGYIKFAPMMDVSKLMQQAINRKYIFTAGGRMRAEDKNTYKASTGGSSPDEYDSAIMLIQLARIRGGSRGEMLPEINATVPAVNLWDENKKSNRGPDDELRFFDIT